MSRAPAVVLDACVLVNFSLCDTLLRLAEPPSLFVPKWSGEIMEETCRTLEMKLAWPAALVRSFEAELRAHFREAWVDGHRPLIPRMTNHELDRHVLAAAVRCGAPLIVTLNLRHFRAEHTGGWGVVAVHPQTFLGALFQADPIVVMDKLRRQASDRGRTIAELARILKQTVPEFAALIADEPNT